MELNMSNKTEAVDIIPKTDHILKPDTTITTDAVVAYFISKYENGLLETKKALSAEITALRSTLEGPDLLTRIKEDIKFFSMHNKKVAILDLTIAADIVVDSWDSVARSGEVLVMLTGERGCSAAGERGCSAVRVNRSIKLSTSLADEIKGYVSSINNKRKELAGILELLSNIGRKEREIRGALAEKALRSIGCDLFDDSSLLQLVNLPTLSSN